MASIFTQILEGTIPGSIIYSDEHCFSILTLEPRQPGHAMVIPRHEYENWLELPDSLRSHLFSVAAMIGQAQREEFDAQRIGLLIEGYEVPHVHIHIWPSQSSADFDPNNIAGPATPDELSDAAQRLTNRISAQ